MSNPIKFSYGLNLPKKTGPAKPSGPLKKKSIFGGDDDDGSDNDSSAFGRIANNKKKQKKPPADGPVVETITELGDDFLSAPAAKPGDDDNDRDSKKEKKKKQPLQPFSQPPPPPNKYKKTSDNASFEGDLASALTARKHADAAEALDPSIYDYDASYDAFKRAAAARKKAAEEAAAQDDPDNSGRKKSKYMTNFRKAAETRQRDRTIAEDKKVKREREAEGDLYADKEQFVTESYKRQQEENRRREEEEKRREAADAKKAEATGMTGFYKQMLERDEQRHAAIVEAAEAVKGGNAELVEEEGDNDEDDVEKLSAARAQEIIAHGGSVAVNEEGEVVDKRELLQGGLNVSSRKKAELEKERERREREGSRDSGRDRDRDRRDRSDPRGGPRSRGQESSAMEEMLLAALKRSRADASGDEDSEEEERHQARRRQDGYRP